MGGFYAPFIPPLYPLGSIGIHRDWGVIWFQRLPSQTIQCHHSLSKYSATETGFSQNWPSLKSTIWVGGPPLAFPFLWTTSAPQPPGLHPPQRAPVDSYPHPCTFSCWRPTPTLGSMGKTLGWTSGKSHQRNRPSTALHLLISLFYSGIKFQFFFLSCRWRAPWVGGEGHGQGVLGCKKKESHRRDSEIRM